MTVQRKLRGRLIAASVAVAASLLVAGSMPAGAVGSTDTTSRTESRTMSLTESQSPVDTPRDIQRDRERASGRSALAGTIPERLRIAGADPALGQSVSAVVLDASTGAVIYSRNASLALMPASNEKLATGFVALSTMGSTKTFHTQVKVSPNRQTVWLVGGGDPGLTVNRAKQLAGLTRAALVRAGVRSVAVRVDDAIFPPATNATGWKASYLPGDVAPVRALVVGERNVMDTSLDAGVIFSNELRRLGISVSSTARGTVAAGAVTLAMARSLGVNTFVSELINTSDNDFAESMHRQSSLATGKGATWTAANGHALATLKARGVNTSGVAIHDGSGLSRSNRMSAANLASLLLAIRRSAVANPVFYGSNAMPTAGVSGTLATRFAQPDTMCARGKVRAKTGTLSDVTALSGTAYGVDGKQRIFSIVENGAADTAAARFALERFATAATGCNPS